MNDQRSLAEQLKELYNLANANGLYDAADHLRQNLTPPPKTPRQVLSEAVLALVEKLRIGRGGEWSAEMIANALVEDSPEVVQAFVRADVLKQVVRWAIDAGSTEEEVSRMSSRRAAPDPSQEVREAFQKSFPHLLPSEQELAHALLEVGYLCGARAYGVLR